LLQLLAFSASPSSAAASAPQDALSNPDIDLPQLLRNLRAAFMTPADLLRLLLRLPLFAPQTVLRALSSGSLQLDSGALAEPPVSTQTDQATFRGSDSARPHLADLWRKASEGLDMTSDLLSLGCPTVRAPSASVSFPALPSDFVSNRSQPAKDGSFPSPRSQPARPIHALPAQQLSAIRRLQQQQYQHQKHQQPQQQVNQNQYQTVFSPDASSPRRNIHARVSQSLQQYPLFSGTDWLVFVA
jgi:hypothetical protein